MKKTRRYKQGFTLAELLIVTAIIAVLVMIAVPVFSNSLQKAKAATCAANRRSFEEAYAVAAITDGHATQQQRETLVAQAAAVIGADASGMNVTGKVCPDGETLTALCSADGSSVSLFCPEHGSNAGDVGGATLDAVLQTARIKSKSNKTVAEYAAALGSNKSVDSEAQAIPGVMAGTGSEILGMLRADSTIGSGVNTFKLVSDGDKKNYTVYYTSAVITDMASGTKLQVQKYDSRTGKTQTVTVTVEKTDYRGHAYMVLVP